MKNAPKDTRVLLLCQHFYPEMVSTGLHMTELATALVEKGQNLRIKVICSSPSKKGFSNVVSKEEHYRGLTIRRLSNLGKEHGSIVSRLIFSLNYFLKSFWLTLTEISNTDVIVVTTNPPFLGLIPFFVSRISRIKYITIVYDIYPDIAVKLGVLRKSSIIVKLWDLITRTIFNYSDKVVVIGEDMKKIVERKMKVRKKIKLIHNWSDSRHVFPVKKEENIFLKEQNFMDKKILLYSGNMGRTHNIEPFLDTAFCLREHKDIVFVFIGSGEKRKLIEKSVREKELRNVTLLPYQPYEILSHVLSSATLALVCLEDDFTGYSVPSKTYGVLAAGRPIIGILRHDSEIAQTIKKYNCGIIFDSNISGEALGENILHIIRNDEMIDAMGNNGYVAFKANFDLEVSARKYLELIEQLK